MSDQVSRSIPAKRHTFSGLLRRLSQAGFNNDFVRLAVLPDWWDEDSGKDPGLLPEVEIRVARFLGLSISALRDPTTRLDPPRYPGAQLRRVRDVDRDRLGPAIHSALRIGAAVVRNLRDRASSPAVPPGDGLAWRGLIERAGSTVKLDDILGDLWRRGIPVVPLEVLPAPSFQGLACIVEGRPAILLGHRYDEPGRVAFVLGHEAGHVAAGDCQPDRPVVDEEEEVVDDADMERLADRYASRVLVGSDSVPTVEGMHFRDLASTAARLERETGADASVAIFAWAARTRDYAMATMAVRALYRSSGARRQLRQHFASHVDLETATESDRALLRCVSAEPERDETAA